MKRQAIEKFIAIDSSVIENRFAVYIRSINHCYFSISRAFAASYIKAI